MKHRKKLIQKRKRDDESDIPGSGWFWGILRLEEPRNLWRRRERVKRLKRVIRIVAFLKEQRTLSWLSILYFPRHNGKEERFHWKWETLEMRFHERKCGKWRIGFGKLQWFLSLSWISNFTKGRIRQRNVSGRGSHQDICGFGSDKSGFGLLLM